MKDERTDGNAVASEVGGAYTAYSPTEEKHLHALIQKHGGQALAHDNGVATITACPDKSADDSHHVMFHNEMATHHKNMAVHYRSKGMPQIAKSHEELVKFHTQQASAYEARCKSCK